MSGKKKKGKPSAWKRFKKWLRGIPHLFAKLTIVWCIVCGTAASFYSLYAQAHGASMEGVLAIVLGFFGGELLFLLLKFILKKEHHYEA